MYEIHPGQARKASRLPISHRAAAHVDDSPNRGVRANPDQAGVGKV